MKKVFMTLVIVFGLITITNAQGITNTLGGNTADDKFIIENSDSEAGLVVTGEGNVGIGTQSPVANLHVSGVDGLLVNGPTYLGITQNLGAGARLHYYSKKRAFRVGYVNGTQWDDANIGLSSVAMGASTTASGDYSTAMGATTTASGDYSFAMGRSTTASGDDATAMGVSTTASGRWSTAIGVSTTASGEDATAMGWTTIASGFASTAMGASTTASGDYSTAMGATTTASGDYSFAMGRSTTASGDDATAMGNYTTASGYASTAIGRYNVGGGNATSWELTDPLFEIGIGWNSGAKANAVTVLKNGNVGIGTATPSGLLDVNGTIYQRGVSLHADYVFDDDYEVESIQEHADFMWTNKHLSAIPKGKVDENGNEIVEIGAHRKGIVEELEKAHIYISQLEERITKLEKLISINN